MLTAEQLMVAHKANMETIFGLTQKAFDGLERLVELNLQVTKAALSDSANHSQAVMGAKDVQELLALQAALMQPLAEKASTYSRQLYEIATGSSAAFNQAAEGQAVDAQERFMALVDSVVRNAPAGSETAVAMMKNTVTAAAHAMESVQKAVKQAQEITDNNLRTIAENTTPATPKATSSRKR